MSDPSSIPRRPIYMDHHATTPVDPRVLQAMLPYFTEVFGNAASPHGPGHQAHEAVELARAQVANLIGAAPKEIVFTSGATESDNLALFGAVEKNAPRGDHVITCVTEHKAVLDVAARLEQLGKRVTYLAVDSCGLIDPDDVKKAITPQTVLISVMMANNEIGTIADIEEIGCIAREHDIPFHTDATQAVGHVPVSVDYLLVDMLSISAHKMYGPKGIGALYIRGPAPRAGVRPMIFGGGHERGVRSGTLNVPGIVGLGIACEIAGRELREEQGRLGAWTAWMLRRFEEQLGDVQLNGHPSQRLAHNLNISIRGVQNMALANALKEDVAFSRGSACTSEKAEPSHVILALGGGGERANTAIRIGLGRQTTQEEVSYVTGRIAEEATRLRKVFRTMEPSPTSNAAKLS
jgi:cysteine desulfurase